MKLFNSSFAVFLIVLVPALLKAQVTLTSNRNPVPGDRVVRYLMDTTGVVEGQNGPNRAWHFSQVTATGETTDVTYIDPAVTPHTLDFPTATVATEYVEGGDSSYTYYVASATHMAMLGMATLDMTVAYTNAEVLLTYPFQFGSQFTDIHTASFDIDEDIHVERNGTISVTADAHGTITLPDGTIHGALRLRIEQEHTDTTYFNNMPMFFMTYSALTYEWYTEAAKFPVFGISYTEINANGTITKGKNVVSVSQPGSVGVEEAYEEQPETFLLEQNFPNPFNPSTTIRYSIPQSAPVTLDVFNLIGQHVARLLDNEPRAAGVHEIAFTPIDLPSGVYVYRLTVGSRMETRKLTLLK